MQQQLYHKSLFAVKISDSCGSQYNLLCLLWVIQSSICCINTSRAPQISLLSLVGVSAYLYIEHRDVVPSLKTARQRTSRGCSETRTALVSRSPSAPLMNTGESVLATPDLSGSGVCSSRVLPLASLGE